MAAADTAGPVAPEPIPEDLLGLNLVELLDQLEPVPAPEPVSLWPQTALWTWLGALLLLVVARLVYRRWQHWRRNAYRRAALAEIVRAGEDPAHLSAILRRTALCAFPRHHVASLYGSDWLNFLDGTCPGAGFDTEAASALASAPYNPATAATGGEGLEKLAQIWVRHHRVPAEQPS